MEVEEAIRSRRAFRILDAKGMERDKLKSLIEASRLSASCFNNQPWRFVYCTDQHQLDLLRAALSRGNAWATKAPLIVAVAAKKEDDCQLSDRRDYYLFDCGLSIGQVLLRATDLGIVAHPIAGYDPAKVRAALGIPEDHVIITLVICAYHGSDDSLLSEKQKAAEAVRPERKPLPDNIYLDFWGQPFE